MFKRLTLLFALLTLPFLFVIAPTVEASPAQFCPAWSELESGELIDLTNSNTQSLSFQQLTQLEAWQSDSSFWIKSSNYGYWGMPADAHLRWEVKLETPTGLHYVIIATSPTDTDNVWVWAYDNLQPTADSANQHYGIHNYCHDATGRPVDFVLSTGAFNTFLGGA